MPVVIHTERMGHWCTVASCIHGFLRCRVAIIGIIQVQVACFSVSLISLARFNFSDYKTGRNTPFLRLDTEYDVEAMVESVLVLVSNTRGNNLNMVFNLSTFL